jgi:hypothetical protein
MTLTFIRFGLVVNVAAAQGPMFERDSHPG